MSDTKQPEPRVVTEVCSLCGVDWKLHGPEPTTETCIRLLLAEVTGLKAQLATRPAFYPYAVRPWPVSPWPRPYWRGGMMWGNAQTSGGASLQTWNATPSHAAIVPKPMRVSERAI